MNTVNPAALLRSLIVYAVCVPMAMLAGYLLCNLDYQSLGFMAVVAAVLIFPLLMKWHYPLLVFSWGFPAVLFFLPTHPTFFMFMVAASLGISTVEKILDREQPSLPVNSIRWPLLALVVVIIITAELTGGFGVRSFGGNTYGGKKYVTLLLGIASFFAITARPIPKQHANLYILLFFAGGFFSCLGDLSFLFPGPLHAIYAIFPVSTAGLDEMGNSAVEFGKTRLGGLAGAGGGFFLWMLARHGFRGCFLTGKLWRPLAMFLMLGLVVLGGFRNNLMFLVIILGILFFLEKIYHTAAILVVILGGFLGGAIIVVLSSHLPFTVQRSLAFLPLPITEEARMSAESTTEWRLEIWKALLPQVPHYLLLGKGYSFSAETFNEFMGANATFRTIDAADNPLAMSSDFHSGPLSVVIPLGIWGVLAWLWFWAASFRVFWRNYHYGDPALRHFNAYLIAAFIASCLSFLFIFGDLVSQMCQYAGLVGLSIALNHGVMSPRSFPAARPATLPGSTNVRPAMPAYT